MPGRSVSCLCGGQEDQLPAGVMTSHAIIRRASSTPGIPKLRTRRVAEPAPRTSTGTSSAERYATAGPASPSPDPWVRARQIAILLLVSEAPVTVTVEPAGA